MLVMAELRLIDGGKPAKDSRVIVQCTCPRESRTFVIATTGLVRNAKGKIIKGAGAYTHWACAYCHKPAE